jgi:outer membrane receptor protein involved in Fe transport
MPVIGPRPSRAQRNRFDCLDYMCSFHVPAGDSARNRPIRAALLATAAALALTLCAGAATAAQDAPDAQAQASGVTSYSPSFFAAQNPGTALDMINRIPGFSLDSGSNVRGFEGAAGNALIDGQRPSSKADSIDQILQRIPAAKVARIDIIRGGAPGIDMQGKTMIANVILKQGGGARLAVSLSNETLTTGRNFPSGRLEASGSLGERTWEAALRGTSNPDDVISNGGRGEVIYADGRPSQISVLNSLGYDVSGSATGGVETPLLGGRLRLNGRLYQEKYNNPETDVIVSPAPDIQHFGFFQKTTDTELGGRYTQALGASANVEIVGLRTTRDRDTDSNSKVQGSASDFLNHQESSETILRGVIKRRFGEQVSLEAGAEGADNQLDSHTTYAIDTVGKVLPAANVQVEEKRSEVFAKATWRPSAAWTIDAALRYESSDISSAGDVVLGKSLAYAKPRLAVSWTPIAATQVRLRYEREVGQLDFNDFVASSNLNNSLGVTAGNPNLNPEQDWVIEVAVEQQLWKGASLILTGRHFAITDVVDRGPVFASDGTVFDRPTNIGAGKRDAVLLDFTLPFDALGWKGALLKGEVSERWTQVTDPTTGQKRAISFTHPNDWNVSFSQDLPRQKLNLGADVYGGFSQTSYRFNLIETFKLRTYVKPYAEWKPKPGLSLRMELPLVTAPRTRLRDNFKIFPGPRGANGAPDIQDRAFPFPRGIYIRLRQDFG